MKKMILLFSALAGISSAFAADFPRPCVVAVDHLYTPDIDRVDYNTYDQVDGSDCAVSYNTVNGKDVETQAGVRVMMLSIAASGAIVRVHLPDNVCYGTEAEAQDAIKTYRTASVCK